ncbi:hypothetical protein MTP99_019114 [Tenebrio molitor]|nr:hypothetical protein MTP99_019114 [Tenebrio molitor]
MKQLTIHNHHVASYFCGKIHKIDARSCTSVLRRKKKKKKEETLRTESSIGKLSPRQGYFVLACVRTENKPKENTKEQYFDSVIYTSSARSRQMQVYLLKQLGQGEETSSDDWYNSFQINSGTASEKKSEGKKRKMCERHKQSGVGTR